MASSARKPATYEDLVQLPDDKIGEIVDGELYASPRPGAPHAASAFELSLDLGEPFQRGRGGPGGWRFLFEPELRLDGDTLNPQPRTILRREAERWVLVATQADAAIVRAEPFDAIELDLLPLWGEERPAPAI